MKFEGVVRKAERIATLLVRQQRGEITLEERMELQDMVCRSDAHTMWQAREMVLSDGMQAAAA